MTMIRLFGLKSKNISFVQKNNRYIVAAYIPPENSPLHDIYDINLFQKLETETSYFSQFGEIYLIGDLNCRVGK